MVYMNKSGSGFICEISDRNCRTRDKIHPNSNPRIVKSSNKCRHAMTDFYMCLQGSMFCIRLNR